MKFTARASSAADFNRWVTQVKQSKDSLDSTRYSQLLKPSENHPVAFYTTYEADLYDRVLMKYSASHEAHVHQEDHEHHE